MSKPHFVLSGVCLDAADKDVLADFYVRLLGWTLAESNEYYSAVVPPDGDGLPLAFQNAENYVPPVWPEEPGKPQQMMHLDFAVAVDDVDAAVAHAVACGATIAPVQYIDYSKVMLDPSGHPFCIGPNEMPA